MSDKTRLIERAFPLKQTSLDSVHEKNVRHGHISTLHIWPARRPLAACRAALIATLLPDPGTPEERQKLCERIGGKVVEKIEKKKMPNGRTVERIKEETEGGILHWLGSEPTSGGKKKQEEYRCKAKFYEEELEWFRQEIRKAYGGRAPRVLDPFAGGGAIPLEAMRLGCEVTAVDINPVAWFILKCTLEYPQKLAGKTHPLPDFILEDEEFMAAFYKAHPHLVGKTKRTKTQAREFKDDLFMKDKPDSGRAPEADLAWHIRAWGKWVLNRARRELAKFYPTYAHFEVGRQASRLPSDSASGRLSSALDADALVPMFLNPVAPTEVKQRRLPHWRQEGVLYFVTFRLADSLPQERVEQLRAEREAWLKAHAEPWSKEATKEYYRLFSDRVEDWLNAGHGKCLLRDPGVRKVVSDALRHFDGTRYDLGAWCVMPNHVHALVRPRPGHELSNILHSWKSFTAHEINKQLGRQGEVWQHEGYDHIVRNPQSLWRTEQYILNNPTCADLGVDEFTLSPLTEISVGSFTISGGRFATETVAPPLMQLVPLKDDGTPDIDSLNAEFSEEYIADKRNPRWVAKPTVAYLWARTVICKNCRAAIPMLKTRWLCRKEKKRVLLTMEPDADRRGVVFGVDTNVPVKGGNAAQRREHDKRIGEGTMSRAGAKCPCCGLPSMTMEDIRAESNARRSGLQLMAVITEGTASKEYRTPTDLELQAIYDAGQCEGEVMSKLAGHSLDEPFEPASTRSISAQLYGVRHWRDLYTSRQRLSLGTLGLHLHATAAEIGASDIPDTWREAISDAVCLSLDRLVCFMCVNTRWKTDADSMTDAFSRFSISLLWDFVEANPLGTTAGGFVRCNDRIATAYDVLLGTLRNPETAYVQHQSAGELASSGKYDLVITDPPYYQAVSYADLSDFFYTWLRGFAPRDLPQFQARSTEKAKEFVQHIRGDKSRDDEKTKYEDQMAEAFRKARSCLTDEGRFVCVFAHKEPDAWETLVSAIISSGFVVTGSWPVQTEMPSRQRGVGVAALASSVWLVCRPRPVTARPGWDNRVLEEMRANITTRLHEFWDAGIRGPDFVWAATGPALEAYSKHPVVKKANDPGKTMEVGEFLSHVRRMVVDYVVGQVLVGWQASGLPSDAPPIDNLDAPTAYYLLHRHDFGLEEAPSGACILYATACGLSDHDLESTWDILVRTGSSSQDEDDENEENDAAAPDAEADPDSTSDSGSRVKLKTWAQRKHRSMGYEAPGGQPVPLIDRIHRLMHLWRAGDVLKVDEYLDEHGLRRQELFKRLVQSLIELSRKNGEAQELQTLESLSNHVQTKGAVHDHGPTLFDDQAVSAGDE